MKRFDSTASSSFSMTSIAKGQLVANGVSHLFRLNQEHLSPELNLKRLELQTQQSQWTRNICYTCL